VYIDDRADRRAQFEELFAADIPRLVTADAAAAVTVVDMREPAIALVDVDASGGCADLLRTLADRYPHVVRMVVGSYADAERSLRVLADGLADRHLTRPWQRAAIVRALSSASNGSGGVHDRATLRQRLAEADRIVDTASALVHDLKSPLMAVLANADHLRTLADEASSLRELLRTARLSPEQRGTLEAILENLLPMSEDLLCATEQLDTMIESLRPLVASSEDDSAPISLSPAAKRGT
jgi:response regulator RpfG family c-di-GMP phosphodiesterase